MMIRFNTVLLTAWLAWCGLTASVSAAPQFPPGVRVGIEPLKGMRPMAGGPGFEDPETNAKIGILDLPRQAYEELQRSLFGPNPGMTIEKRESFPFDNGIAFLLTARATADGVAVRRWYFLATSTNPLDDLVAFIQVEVPEKARAVHTDKLVRASLASVSFRASPIEEQLSLLPFTIGELAGFRVMKAIPTGGVILVDGPTEDLAQHPHVIISIGAGAPGDADERAKFSRQMLASAPMRELSITSGETMRVGGRPGHEIRANAVDLTGNPVSLVQWVRFNGSAYIRIVGVSRRDQWDKQFPRFRSIRDGVDPK